MTTLLRFVKAVPILKCMSHGHFIDLIKPISHDHMSFLKSDVYKYILLKNINVRTINESKCHLEGLFKLLSSLFNMKTINEEKPFPIEPFQIYYIKQAYECLSHSWYTQMVISSIINSILRDLLLLQEIYNDIHCKILRTQSM